MSSPPSGQVRALAALNEAGVEYVVVGVGGINFYARTPALAFATLDLDLLIAPRTANLSSALRALAALGFSFEAGGEPFVDYDDDTMLARVVERAATLSALHEEHGQVDVMTGIGGTSFADLAGDATSFVVEGQPVRVARLEKLLLAKHRSGRPKDVAFLRAYEARASEDEEEDPS